MEETQPRDEAWTMLDEQDPNDLEKNGSFSKLFRSAMDLGQDRTLLRELPDRQTKDDWMARALDAERRLEDYRGQIAILQSQLRPRRSGTSHDEDWDRCTDLAQSMTQEDRLAAIDEMLKAMYSKANEPFCEAKTADMSELDTFALAKKAAVAVDRVVEQWNQVNQWPMHISFTQFNINDIALFLPTSTGTYMAFNVGCPNYFLSQESQALIGQAKHFHQDYVLGRVVQIDTCVAALVDGKTPYGVPSGTAFGVVSTSIIL